MHRRRVNFTAVSDSDTAGSLSLVLPLFAPSTSVLQGVLRVPLPLSGSDRDATVAAAATVAYAEQAPTLAAVAAYQACEKQERQKQVRRAAA